MTATCNFFPQYLRKPGVSAQLLSCGYPIKDECGNLSCTPAGADVAIVSGTLDNSNWVRGWVSQQLTTEAESDEFLNFGGSRRGWWADIYRKDGFKTGSLLWTIGLKTTKKDESARLAKLYVQQALKYLVTWSIASKILVTTTWVTRCRLMINIEIHRPCGPLKLTVTGNQAPDMNYLWN